MRKIGTREEFMDGINVLLEGMFDAAEAAAKDAGEPVNALSALESALIEDGILTAKQADENPCFRCMSKSRIHIDADGTVYDPDDNEEEDNE